MDTITHGIAGSLLGKSFFSNSEITSKNRLTVFAVTAGAVFPDADVFAYIFGSDPMGIIKYHRGITHSYLGLPFFAIVLALLTRLYARMRNLDSPGTFSLAVAYGVGILSHILLDSLTSFGTRIWDPMSQHRIAWDVLFIIDFTFTAIVLIPQVATWVYGEPSKARGRAWKMWILFTICGALAWAIIRAVGLTLSAKMILVVSLTMAAIFLFPAWTGSGYAVSRAGWCRAGTWLAIVYIGVCAVAHHRAIQRVESFAQAHGLKEERYAALPIPPSFWDWNGLIRTSDGVYSSHFDLRDSAPPQFEFVADSPPNKFSGEAFKLSDVRTYWLFARFPVIYTSSSGDQNIVEFADLRFRIRRGRGPAPLTLQLIYDSAGTLELEHWLRLDRSVRNEADTGTVPQESDPR